MTAAVTAHLLAHGRWVDLAATPMGMKVGGHPLCHFTVLDRWCSRAGSRACFGFGLYPYGGRFYLWFHSRLIDTTAR